MCGNIFIWKWPQLRLCNLLSNHGDLLEGIGVFLAISGICQTFDEGLEVQLACRQYSLHLKPKALRHQHYMEGFPVKGNVEMSFLVKNMLICTKIAAKLATYLLVFPSLNHHPWINNISQRFAHFQPPLIQYKSMCNNTVIRGLACNYDMQWGYYYRVTRRRTKT